MLVTNENIKKKKMEINKSEKKIRSSDIKTEIKITKISNYTISLLKIRKRKISNFTYE